VTVLVESESLDEKFRMDFYKSGTFEMRWGSRIGDSQERRWEKMAQSTTGKKVTARERARLAIAEGLAEELREQERIAAARETATTRFFEAEERREVLEAELATIDADRGSAVLELDGLGLRNRVPALLGLSEGEVRRLRKASTPVAATPGAESPNQSAEFHD
jgi:hypothetical protein